jgi:hypothetical protein
VLVRQEGGVTHLLDAHALEHLTNDDSMCLSLIVDTLQAVDLLDLVDEPRREFLLALDLKDVVRVGGTVHERLTRAHAVAVLDGEGACPSDEVLLGLAHFGDNHDLALALGVLAEVHHTVDLRDDGAVLRLTGLEELGHAGQTARDVLGLRGLARDLRDDLAGFDL